jgi:hypothetical protein
MDPMMNQLTQRLGLGNIGVMNGMKEQHSSN